MVTRSAAAGRLAAAGGAAGDDPGYVCSTDGALYVRSQAAVAF